MRRTTRVTVAAMAVSMLALAGCGRSGGEPGAQDTSAAPVATQNLSGTVTVWAMGTEGEALGTFSKAFTDKYPNVKVDVTAIPWDAAHDKIATAIAAKQTPDVSMIGTTWMGEFASTGGLDPTPPVVDKSTFFDGAWGSTVVGNASYGVPWYVETRVLYLDTLLAKKAGVSQTPATWADLTATAKGLQKAGAQWGINLQPGQTGAWQTFLPFAWQAGANLMSSDGKLTLDTPEMVKALTYYQSFFTDKVAPTALPDGTLEPDFVAGKIGSFVSGPWEIGTLKTLNPDVMSKVTLAPLPADAKPASFIGGSDLAVFKNSKNRDASWAFVQWLSDPKVQADWYKTTSDLPAVTSAWKLGSLATDPALKVFGDQMKNGVAAPAIPTWEQVAAVIDTELEKVCKSGEDPARAAKNIQQQADQIGTGL